MKLHIITLKPQFRYAHETTIQSTCGMLTRQMPMVMNNKNESLVVSDVGLCRLVVQQCKDRWSVTQCVNAGANMIMCVLLINFEYDCVYVSMCVQNP